MLKRPLSRKHHGCRGLGFITGLDRLVVPHGAAGVGDGLDTLAQGHVNPVPEGEEGVGDHGCADEAAFVGFGLGVDLCL